MNKKLIAATILAMTTWVGTSSADLITDLGSMPADEALAKAMAVEGTSIETLITEAAAQFADSPQLLKSLIAEAVASYPEQARQIVFAAVKAAPEQKTSITQAAISKLGGNAAAISSVNQAANAAIEAIAQNTDSPAPTPDQQEILQEAQQEEIDPPVTVTLPPPPVQQAGGSNDKPVSVSPTS
ncbi:hypothetical protein [Endozoicomonas ascidiicola]|uniref:hypothetical protein n=1 Tax=Endozoicomonas ascidiicola TaxID=1698521 RepID=UPI00082F0444|nr:hypothetical protein [Endozoicomonas ascidiicola]